MTTAEAIIDIPALRAEWEDKLKPLGRAWGHAHFKCPVEILSGDPPREALILAANGWEDVYFGGTVVYKYAAPDNEWQLRRYALVRIYTD